MSINLVLATDLNGGLGFKGELLFRLSADMRRFKLLTENSYCIMGRKTWESLPTTLSNRKNVIITRYGDYYIDPHLHNKHDIEVHTDLHKIINHYQSGYQEKDLNIIGGGGIYRQTVLYADKVFLTLFHQEREHDASFPLEVLDKHFEVVHKEEHEVDGLRFDFIDYVRKGNVDEGY